MLKCQCLTFKIRYNDYRLHSWRSPWRRLRGHNILLCKPNLKFSSRVDQVRCTYKAVRNLGFPIGKHIKDFKDELHLETTTQIFLNLLSVHITRVYWSTINSLCSMDSFENRFNWIVRACSGMSLYFTLYLIQTTATGDLFPFSSVHFAPLKKFPRNPSCIFYLYTLHCSQYSYILYTCNIITWPQQKYQMINN